MRPRQWIIATRYIKTMGTIEKKYFLQSLSVFIKSFYQGVGIDETVDLLNSLYLTSQDSENPLLFPIVKFIFENLPQKDYRFSEKKQAFVKST
jgi:hypothetical protein